MWALSGLRQGRGGTGILMAARNKRASLPDPRQTSFVVAVADVEEVIRSELEVLLELARKAERAGDRARVAELRCAVTALGSVRERVERLGLG